MVRQGDKLRRALERRRKQQAAEPSENGPRTDGRAGASGDLSGSLRRRFERRGGLPAPRGEPVEIPAGDVVSNDHGSCFVVTRRYPLDSRHGEQALRVAFDAQRDVLAEYAKDDDLEFVPRNCLFLDTETTGLGGGAGTTVFMVGLGFFDGDELVVEQVFLRDFGEEPAALRHVAQRVWEYPLMVTYVGKSFDRHRLAARMAVQKVRSPMLNAPHLDLFYLARRRYGDELPNHKLRTLEEWRLGVFREDDLPGAEAPAAYLDWLRDGTGPVDRVFEHNHLDVLSLVTLLGVLGQP